MLSGDEYQMYFALLGLKASWKVYRVSVYPGKNTVDVYITLEKGGKLPCPVCVKKSMVYGHIRERICRELYFVDSDHLELYHQRSISESVFSYDKEMLDGTQYRREMTGCIMPCSAQTCGTIYSIWISFRI